MRKQNSSPRALGEAQTIAVISDVHANMEALNAVWTDIQRLLPDRVICLGDIVGYGPDPEEVVRFFMHRNIPTVAGNHEQGVLGIASREDFNPFGLQALEISDRLLSREAKDYLSALPQSIHEDELCFVHGFPPDSPHKYLFEADSAMLRTAFEESPFSFCFVGHTHDLELIGLEDGNLIRAPLAAGKTTLDRGRFIINCGSVGQPRDKDNRAKYAVFDRKKKVLEMRSVPYDFETTIKKLITRGFPETYARRLR
ncbi:MAG: metallophosphoesterase family protein [Desulfonatronovibrionaceae bacterium]